MTARRSPSGTDHRSGPDPVRPWRDRLADPAEPLFTVAIAADLFGVDTQVLRRLADAIAPDADRPSGNQRRYSRLDLEIIGRALELAQDGHHPTSIVRIFELEQRVADLTHEAPPPRR